jgi:hypothetical protein
VRVGRNKAGVARKEFPLQEQRERHRQPPVVLRKLALHSGDGVAPSRSAGNAYSGGQSHETWGHPSHRHAQGGGNMVHMDLLGRSGSLRPG